MSTHVSSARADATVAGGVLGSPSIALFPPRTPLDAPLELRLASGQILTHADLKIDEGGGGAGGHLVKSE